jgi:CheY-like chemotaxis protein
LSPSSPHRFGALIHPELDINLINPGRGWSTLDALRLHPKTRHIPVIVCSTDMRMINEKAEMLRELPDPGKALRA